MALLSKNTSPDGFQTEVLFLCPCFPQPNLCNSTPERAPYIPIHMDNPPASPHLCHLLRFVSIV